MSYIQEIVLDLDGTLFGSDKACRECRYCPSELLRVTAGNT